MAAPAAAEVPVLAYLVVGLLALLGWAVCRGLRGVWINTLGLMLLALADVLKYDKAFIHIDFGGPIRALNTTVLNAITSTGQKFEHSAGYFFHGAAIIQGWAARELVGLARDVLAWGTWLQHSHLPKWVKALIYAAIPPALILRLVKAAIDANLPHLGRVVVGKVGITRGQVKAMIVAALAGLGTLPIPGINIFPRLRDLERFDITTRARLKKIGWVGSFTGAAALVGVGLRKLGLSWVRCSNVAKAGKAICKADVKWLENLLLGALLIFGTISLRTFAVEVYGLMNNAIREVAHFWRADLKHAPVNPGLGDIGNDRFLTAASGGVRANPGLGEIG